MNPNQTMSRRLWRLAFLLLISLPGSGLLPSAGLAAPVDQAEVAEEIATEFTVDLPAIALDDDELPTGTDSVQRDFGELLSIDHVADMIAQSGELTNTEARDKLEEYGWLGRFEQSFFEPSALDPEQVGVLVVVGATEYADEAGANQAFDLPDTTNAPGVAVDAPEVGDQSRLVNHEGGRNSIGQDYTAQFFTFRHERMIGNILVYFFAGNEHDLLTPEAMADSAAALLAHIETVMDGDSPGLSLVAVRPAADPAVGWLDRIDDYTAREGEYLSRYKITPESLADHNQDADDWGLVDEYIAQGFVRGDLLGTYTNYIDVFASDRQAEAYVPIGIANDLESYGETEELDRVPGTDREMHGLHYIFTEADGTVLEGYRLYTVVDDMVIGLEIDSELGIPLDDVVKVVELQADCLEDGGPGELFPFADLVRAGDTPDSLRHE